MTRRELQALIEATGCAMERGGRWFLCDPHWSAAERTQAETLWAGGEPAPAAGWLAIRTGGSGGGVKFARHDEHTLGAAVAGFVAHFGLERVNAVDVLPAHHVSGFMARVRCMATGGTHIAWDWKRLEAGDRPAMSLAAGPWALSLVPTQLQRLLGSPEAIAWLRTFAVIFVGGGPTWAELAEAAAEEGLPLSLSYGMTETAAMVTALRPAEFLAGARNSGAPLPHAVVRITDAGVVAIAGASIHHGYVGGEALAADPREFVTEDLGRLDARGQLHLLGRRDAVIITGGKKVQPEIVEAALRASGEFVDVAVVGVPDAEWGEAVVACFLPTDHVPDVARAVARLAPHERPKRFVPVAPWPRNVQGKVNRAELARRLAAG